MIWLSANYKWLFDGFGGALAIAVIVFVVNWLRKRWSQRPNHESNNPSASRPSTSEQAKIFEIRFEYLPGNLLDNGWVRAYPKDAPARPNATVASDAPIAGSINIETYDGHAYNFSLPMNARLSDRLVFAAKYTSTTMIFTDVQLSSKDGTQKMTKQIKYLLGRGAPHPTKDWENDEWTFLIPGEPLKNEWRKFDIALPDVVAKTWGTKGLIFRGIERFRIRGSLGVSPVEFYETVGPV